MGNTDDCCPGEPFMGDPKGLHTFDCPVYLKFADALATHNAALRAKTARWQPPRVWALPAEPNATMVRDRHNVRWTRTANVRPWRGNGGVDLTWAELLARGPLVEEAMRGRGRAGGDTNE